jgi:hypothetical protein
MNPQSKWTAYGLAFAVIAGHAYCFVVRRDIWPFSHYEMYAGVRGPNWTHLEIVGIAATPGKEDVKLPAEGVHPPRNIRVMTGIGKLLNRSQEDPSTRPHFERALAGVARLYTHEMAEHFPGFPRLQGVRLYRQTWARDVSDDGPVFRMLHREQVAEAITGGSS